MKRIIVLLVVCSAIESIYAPMVDVPEPAEHETSEGRTKGYQGATNAPSETSSAAWRQAQAEGEGERYASSTVPAVTGEVDISALKASTQAAFKKSAPAQTSTFQSGVKSIGDKLSNNTSTLSDALTSLKKAISDFFAQAPSDIANFSNQLFQALKNLPSQLLSALRDSSTQDADDLDTQIDQAINDMQNDQQEITNLNQQIRDQQSQPRSQTTMKTLNQLSSQKDTTQSGLADLVKRTADLKDKSKMSKQVVTTINSIQGGAQK